MKIHILTFLLVMIVLHLLSISMNAQNAARTNVETRVVKVYFGHENDSELHPLKRRVSTKTPLQGALQALLDGPTGGEQKRGYEPVVYVKEMKLDGVKIKLQTAYIHFIRKEIQGNPPDLGSLRFEAAVIRTARQFPNVKNVIVCVNGQLEFGIGLTIDKARPCPKG